MKGSPVVSADQSHGTLSGLVRCVLVLTWSLPLAAAHAQRCEQENYTCESSISLYWEEDNLQANWHALSPHTDRNYTMGLGFARGGPSVVEQGHNFALKWADRTVAGLIGSTIGRVSRLSFLRRFDRRLESPDFPKAYNEMLAGTAFTPETLAKATVISRDRPYAFLLGWTVRRSALVSENVAVTTDLTVGTIGSRLGRNVQRFIHRQLRGPAPCDPVTGANGPCDPKGWSNQIHDTPALWGGIPTLRYEIAAERRFSPGFIEKKQCSRLFEALLGVGGEAGYYTDAYASTRFRLGYFSSPFYSWWQNPLSVGSIIVPLGHVDAREPRSRVTQCVIYEPNLPSRVEGFAYGGIRPRVWAYNALLQGYPGYDGYAFSRSDVSTFEADGELGVSVVARFGPKRKYAAQLSWEYLGMKSPEFEGPRARKHAYGGIFLSFVH
jgi:hypothetical protein